MVHLPVTFPAEAIPGGKLLSGQAAPDLGAGAGLPTLYTTDLAWRGRQTAGGGQVLLLHGDTKMASRIIGPASTTTVRCAASGAGRCSANERNKVSDSPG